MEKSMSSVLKQRTEERWLDLGHYYLQALEPYIEPKDPEIKKYFKVDESSWYKEHAERLVSALANVGLSARAAMQISEACLDVFPESIQRHLNIGEVVNNLPPHVQFSLSISASIARKRCEFSGGINVNGSPNFPLDDRKATDDPINDPHCKEFAEFFEEMVYIDHAAMDVGMHFFARMLQLSAPYYDQLSIPPNKQ